MEFKLISDIENPLFNRREIEGELHSDATPSREEVLNFLSKKLSIDLSFIKIRTIKGKFGQKVFLIVANIYKSKEDKEKIENQKKKDIELEKKLTAPKEEAKEEKSVEGAPGEKVEEKTVEVAEEKKEEPKVEEPIEVKEGKKEVIEEKSEEKKKVKE